MLQCQHPSLCAVGTATIATTATTTATIPTVTDSAADSPLPWWPFFDSQSTTCLTTQVLMDKPTLEEFAECFTVIKIPQNSSVKQQLLSGTHGDFFIVGEGQIDVSVKVPYHQRHQRRERRSHDHTHSRSRGHSCSRSQFHYRHRRHHRRGRHRHHCHHRRHREGTVHK